MNKKSLSESGGKANSAEPNGRYSQQMLLDSSRELKNTNRLCRVAFVAVLILFVFLSNFGLSLTSAGATSAGSMVVIESSTNRILYQHNAYSRRFMASTTKILTAIVVIEHCSSDEIVVVSKEATGIEGSSIYLQQGEKITVKDLLYGLMLKSGNDAAVALAIHVGGSVAKFADMMNVVAKRVGAVSSNFVNPHGLHDNMHYTTAYDLALISSYAMQNDMFREISATKLYTMDRVLHKHKIVNKNKILSTFEGGDGIKTGFTKRAGRCLVSSATQNGMQVICVVLNCGPMFEESRVLMKRAFDSYTMTEILPSYNIVGSVPVQRGRQAQVRAYSHIQCNYPLKNKEIDSIKRVVSYDELTAPINVNNEVGRIDIYLHGRKIFEGALYSMDKVGSQCIGERMKELIHDWFG